MLSWIVTWLDIATAAIRVYVHATGQVLDTQPTRIFCADESEIVAWIRLEMLMKEINGGLD